MKLIEQTRNFFCNRLWQEECPGVKGFLVQALRLLVLAVGGLVRNRSWLQAATLAYATMLALIPLMALLFAILKGLGLQRLLAMHIMERLAPGSHDFATQIFQYIEGTQVTSLGVFGVVVLLGALVVLMTNVERAFNETWQVPRTRPWRRKLSDYLSIFLIFPVLMAVAISISSGFLSQPEIRRFLSGIMPEAFFTATSGLASLGLLWIAFSFIYLVMPNARVHFTSAVLGGVVGGSLWQVAHVIFAWFQGAATYYNAIYGALYHLLFLVIWMFWSWLIVLFGTEVAFAHQNLTRLRGESWRFAPPPEPVDEYLALAVLLIIGGRYARRQPLLNLEELGRMLLSSDSQATRVAEVLRDCRLIMEMPPLESNGSVSFIPAAPLEQITGKEVLDCLRQSRGAAMSHTLAQAPRLEAIFQRLLHRVPPSPWDALTLKELVELMEQEPAPE
ncbi:MAG: YihY/virulence factor BrkB family protein [Thermodesulfobacteriota bacterium]